MSTTVLEQPRVVSQDEWLAARKELLAREKAHTRERGALSAQRRALPWVKVEKPYVFDGPQGGMSLAELFEGRSQLILAHFMFGPEWDEGCVGCSFRSDHADGALVHLEHHDVSFASVSRAPIGKIEAFRKRMGWRFRWVSSYGTDFNYDFGVSFTAEQVAAGMGEYNYGSGGYPGAEQPGISVFARDGNGDVFHTYSTYGRGDETLVTAYMYLDMTPKGRAESGPNFNLMDWVRHHDRYGADAETCGCRK